MLRKKLLCLKLLLVLSFFYLPLNAEEVRIAVASNFIAPMKEITHAFKQHSESKVKLSFGSSGKLFAQISHGAPFDIFLSADQDKPLRLRQLNMAVEDSQFTYAYGSLVLWSRNKDLSAKAFLQSNQFKKLALANPKLAPYGIAAAQVLNDLKITDTSKWVMAENIAQTFQFVHSQNADLGFVARSQLPQQLTPENSYWIIPHDLYAPIRQDAVLLTKAEHNKSANQFIRFLKSEAAKAILINYGYQFKTDKGND